jgi:hypothetical protein
VSASGTDNPVIWCRLSSWHFVDSVGSFNHGWSITSVRSIAGGQSRRVVQSRSSRSSIHSFVRGGPSIRSSAYAGHYNQLARLRWTRLPIGTPSTDGFRCALDGRLSMRPRRTTSDRNCAGYDTPSTDDFRCALDGRLPMRPRRTTFNAPSADDFRSQLRWLRHALDGRFPT